MVDINANHTVSKVHELLKKNREMNERRSQNGPAIAFLPEGQHKIRWFFDPEGTVYREVMTNRQDKTRFHCPNFLSNRDKDLKLPECEACARADATDDWRVRCRYNCMIYGYLYDTKSSNKYWEPGKPYVILGNSKLRRSIVEMMEALIEEEESLLMSMITPQVPGCVANVNVTRGAQGSVNIQVLPKTVDPIEIGDWYQPLHQVWIPEGFDQEAYDTGMKSLKASWEAEESEDAETVTLEDDGDLTDADDVNVADLLDDIAAETSDDTEEATVNPKGEDPVATTEEVVEDELMPETSAPTTPESDEPEVVVEDAEEPVEALSDDAVEPEIDEIPEVEENFDLVPFPEGVEALVPEECPGWAKYKPTQAPCLVCVKSVDCLAVVDAMRAVAS